MAEKVPDIKPIKVKEFSFKQSKYKQCGALPVRGILLGPSGAGKGVLLQNMILDIYRGCFNRIYIYFHLALKLIIHGNPSKNT